MPSNDNKKPAAKLTVKQEREARRAEKVEQMRRAQAKATRNRRITIGSVVGAAALIVVLVIVFVVTGSSSAPAPVATQADGVQTFAGLTRNHVTTPVTYPQVPPVGGDHNPVWLNCGIYDQAVPNENAVHSLEHGTVWVTYDATKVTGDALTKLRSELPNTYIILSPYVGLPSPVVASAWGAQIQLTGPDDARLQDFLKTYWQSPNAPEPGAACTGGVTAPGYVSA
ncbi:DUF3105 domain-containing protein [Subtercola endophyticus]|uniref:DUF3105 domain-containing protein n=1 Tax=Subtercola endophyticus TaxID=2895559 RepID=UPI001E4437FB|nr:DUF3105 domain-containing protein [Subtercola endophyticus]UFS59947.1 DUF3105 domain-containing protein [Subtercola endophyticus]